MVLDKDRSRKSAAALARNRGKTRSPTLNRRKAAAVAVGKAGIDTPQLSMHGISDMIEQIRHCESILARGLNDNTAAADDSDGGAKPLSERLLAKVNRLNSLAASGGASDDAKKITASIGLNRNNNKCCRCCGGAPTSSNAMEQDMQCVNTDSADEEADYNAEEGKMSSHSEKDKDQGMYPKHQDYCLCHKRRCHRCNCLCPCTEHFCPGCGIASRVTMTMRAVDGLKVIENAQKERHRKSGPIKGGRCKSKRKGFLMRDTDECNHAVMVRVGGGFVPLVEYLKSHNKVVLSKFTRDDGSAFLSPWRPYYAGPLKKGRPRGIRYVDSVTQQLEEIIFANKEAGKSPCKCT